MLAAYAFSDRAVSDAWCLKKIFYRLDDIDEVVSSLENPAFMGFSNAIWNYRYNLELAAKVKSEFPECVIEFGGHHVPPTTEYLEKYPFIDILGHGKGEESLKDILAALSGDGDFSNIPNISYRTGDGEIIKNRTEKITICDYPSPYLMGIFDDILKDDYEFSCVLETNRGCPYNCSYCDWGELNSRVRLFPLEKVMAELEWMSRNKIQFVYCIDANFGMFERDVLVAQKLVELKETTGYPNRLQVSYAKNEFDRTFRISRMLAEHGIGKGATLSLQSMSETALKNVGRQNIPRERYVSQIRRYRDAGVPTYTELILGLPGETAESFERGLCEVLEMGQHNSVTVYNFELLPNSELSKKENLEKFGIKTVCTSLDQYHCGIMEKTTSGLSNIVVGTDTLSVDEWVEVSNFCTFVQSLHHFGLFQCIAMYVRKECGVSYYDFYTGLYGKIKETKLCRDVFGITHNILRNFADGKGSLIWYNETFGKITYPVEEAAYLMLHKDRAEFYREMIPFVENYFEDRELMKELFRYQDDVLLKPGRNNYSSEFAYSFAEYFDAILRNDYIPLEKRKSVYEFSSPFEAEDYPEFARVIVWYGRRNGRMLYTNKPSTITLKSGEILD